MERFSYKGRVCLCVLKLCMLIWTIANQLWFIIVISLRNSEADPGFSERGSKNLKKGSGVQPQKL